jgi:hypothetical protein
MTYKVFICFFVLALITDKLISQEDERFRLIFSAGLSGTQVDGDTYGGYNKVGINAGVYINRKTGEKTEYAFGLTYIQKGSRSNATIQNPNYYILRLNYVEVPWLFIYNHKSKYRFELGLSGAYLFSNYEENGMVGAYKGNLKKFDFCYNMSAGYKLNEHLFVNLKYNYSLLPIREYNRSVYLGNFWQRTFNKGLYNNCVSISLNYIISPNSTNNE